MVDDAILKHEGAHARPLAGERSGVGSDTGGDLDDDRVRSRRLPRRHWLVIVFIASLALLRLGYRDVEVEVEVGAVRRRPGENPPHPPLERLQLGE